MNAQKPLLSIGMIFKNEIRCIERCMKALQPLRDAIPCELVMVDTGATDGSREVAERYADILVDFAWIDDFAAARNAAMDRCSGEWYFTIDCDEWLDTDVSGFVQFLTTDKEFNFGSVIVRNYSTFELEQGGDYSDFMAVRLLRMSTGVRYEGAIHEHWPYKGALKTMLIRGGLLHHDGYLFQDTARLEAKQKRNMALLLKELEKDPDGLLILMQCIESGAGDPNYADWMRRAVKGVEEKQPMWNAVGPAILRHAVRGASALKLPELKEWLDKAEELFPENIFTTVDVGYFAFGYEWGERNYAAAIRRGEQYLQALDNYRTGRYNRADLLASSLFQASPHAELCVETVLASAYLKEKQPEKCAELMARLDGGQMDFKQTGDSTRVFLHLYSYFDCADADIPELLLKFWTQINQPTPSEGRAEQRRQAFLREGIKMFDPAFRETEDRDTAVIRHAYTLFLPLGDQCVLGTAAEVLQTEDPQLLAERLAGVERLEELPIGALAHALGHGVSFPLPEKPLNIEEMDALAARLAEDKERFLPMVQQICGSDPSGSTQKLLWRRGLAVAAVRVFDWKDSAADTERGMGVARIFAEAERKFIPACYAQGALQEDSICMLPPLHRFGWYCARAFEALDMGDAAGYVRLLRAGLDVCKDMKAMVEFLTQHTPQLHRPEPSEELAALAEQIRTILSAYPMDDPAVVAIKNSEAYQKVAYLIEGAAVPIVGGLTQ